MEMAVYVYNFHLGIVGNPLSHTLATQLFGAGILHCRESYPADHGGAFAGKTPFEVELPGQQPSKHQIGRPDNIAVRYQPCLIQAWIKLDILKIRHIRSCRKIRILPGQPKLTQDIINLDANVCIFRKIET